MVQVVRPSHQSGCLRLWVFHSPTRIQVRLLGPCFKTGRLAAFCQHLEDAAPEGQSAFHALVDQATSAEYQPPLLSCQIDPCWPTPGTYSVSRETHRPRRIHSCQSLPPQQFQALFNSLFKVLFIFPSRYLFAIGLLPIFSLRRDLPPA